MTATQTLDLLRREIARKMEYHAEQYAASEAGDGGILYHGGAHDTLRDLQVLVGEPECTCGHPGLTYDGPDEDCPKHGRTPHIETTETR